MLYTSPFDQFRIWLTKFFKKEEFNSDFLEKKPKLKKVVGYDDNLSYNETFTHIFKQIKK